MGRLPRVFEPNGIYHVFARGSSRRAIFLYDADRLDFLAGLERTLLKYELPCFAYCLMANHYHLVVQTPDKRLSVAMKEVNGGYSLRFNRRHGRDAHLFKNRFGAVQIEGERQLLWTLAYVVANPVRAGLCAAPDDWPWASYRASIGLETAPDFLSLDRLLSFFADTPRAAVSRYIRLVESAASPATAVSDTSDGASGSRRLLETSANAT